ncbi:hypothetical protein [Paenibacillus prosopidis]|uniref:hypothetical protein n=1 Tax=Paenibacillus prosopidis TaxID=630520 RepID=UPI0011C03A6F|nr:hypothetical protein [Paenibacillus prosopidis]
MNYYERMLRAFSRKAIIYTLLIEPVFLQLYWFPSRHRAAGRFVLGEGRVQLGEVPRRAAYQV